MSEITKVFYSTNPDSVTLHSRIKLTQTQKDYVIAVRDECLPFIKRTLSRRVGHEIKHWIQGSYKNNTLIRPVQKGQEFDIDIGLYIFAEETIFIDATDVKARLRQTLLDYSNSTTTYSTSVPEPKQNCERLVFEALSFHLDFPLYRIDESKGICSLASESGDWIDSDPRALQDWFDQKTSGLDNIQKARLRRLIQYFKTWVSLVWRDEPKGRMPSIAITVIAAEYYRENQFDDIAFMHFSQNVEAYFSHNEKLQSPVNGDDLLKFDHEQLESLRSELQQLVRRVRLIEQAQTNAQKFIYWSEIFEYMFPPVMEHPWLNDNGKAMLPAMSTPPEIKTVHKLKGNQIRRTSTNEDVTAYKGEKLLFSIQNSSKYPSTALCTWTVRNQGESALSQNDIGHVVEDDISAEREENCEYDGVHYMECVITNHAVVLGINSIKVKIHGFERPERNPTRRKIFKGL